MMIRKGITSKIFTLFVFSFGFFPSASPSITSMGRADSIGLFWICSTSSFANSPSARLHRLFSFCLALSSLILSSFKSGSLVLGSSDMLVAAMSGFKPCGVGL